MMNLVYILTSYVNSFYKFALQVCQKYHPFKLCLWMDVGVRPYSFGIKVFHAVNHTTKLLSATDFAHDYAHLNNQSSYENYQTY